MHSGKEQLLGYNKNMKILVINNMLEQKRFLRGAKTGIRFIKIRILLSYTEICKN